MICVHKVSCFILISVLSYLRSSLIYSSKIFGVNGWLLIFSAIRSCGSPKDRRRKFERSLLSVVDLRLGLLNNSRLYICNSFSHLVYNIQFH